MYVYIYLWINNLTQFGHSVVYSSTSLYLIKYIMLTRYKISTPKNYAFAFKEAYYFTNRQGDIHDEVSMVHLLFNFN